MFSKIVLFLILVTASSGSCKSPTPDDLMPELKVAKPILIESINLIPCLEKQDNLLLPEVFDKNPRQTQVLVESLPSIITMLLTGGDLDLGQFGDVADQW